MTVAEATKEGRGVPHFEDLLYIRKLEGALADVVVVREWIVNAWHNSLTVNAVRYSGIKVLA